MYCLADICIVALIFRPSGCDLFGAKSVGGAHLRAFLVQGLILGALPGEQIGNLGSMFARCCDFDRVFLQQFFSETAFDGVLGPQSLEK